MANDKKKDVFLLKLYLSFILQWLIFMIIMAVSIVTVRASFQTFVQDFDVLWISPKISINQVRQLMMTNGILLENEGLLKKTGGLNSFEHDNYTQFLYS